MKDSTKPPADPSAASQRRRGALSCAECRRLKLRCDRVFPCSSCKKRGCAAICPDGALTTGKGNRFILANTEELHERIEALQERITQLEGGLLTLHLSTNGADADTHPLLTDDLLNIKTPIGAEIVGTANPRQRKDASASSGGHDDGSGAGGGAGAGGEGSAGKSNNEQDEDGEEVVDSFGTLALGEGSGKAKFFGVAAGAHYLLGEDPESDEEESKPTLDGPSTSTSTNYNNINSYSYSYSNNNNNNNNDPSSSTSSSGGEAKLPARLANLSRSYPFSTLAKDWPAAKEQLRCFLPDAHKAWSLSEQYFEHGAWLYIPVSRLHYVEKIFTPILDPSYDPSNTSKPQPTPADYATLFIVLALGSLLNLAQPPSASQSASQSANASQSASQSASELSRARSTEGAHYHALARAALGAVEPLSDTLGGVQALLLICFYNQLADDKDGPARAWSLSGLAYKMSAAIGLHRDGKRWNLSPEEADKRRTVFWELAMFDAWSSQALGRPPTMFTNHVDCAYPTDIPEHFDEKGVPEMSFQRNKYVYAKTLIDIFEQAFAAKRPTYDVILRFDRKLRDLEVPVGLQVLGLNSNPTGRQPPQPTTRAQVMQAHTTLCIKETCLIYLHRGYLARALSEHPDDPFKSRYAASVLAAHKSSCAVLAGVRNALYLLPRLMPRVFFLWIHAFSAAMVLATIVIRSPSSNLVSSSLRELDLACDMFERAKEGCKPAQLLPTLLKLREKAHTVYEEFRQGKPRFLSPPIDSLDGSRPEDDLTMLGGKSRLVRLKEKSHHHSSNASVPSPPSQHSLDDSISAMEENSPRPAPSDFHPALAEYLKAYNQQLQHHEASGIGGSPDSYRVEMVAHAVAQVTGDMTVLGSSLEQTPLEFAYGYGLPDQQVMDLAMARADLNPAYSQQQQQQQHHQQQQQQQHQHQHNQSQPQSQGYQPGHASSHSQSGRPSSSSSSMMMNLQQSPHSAKFSLTIQPQAQPQLQHSHSFNASSPPFFTSSGGTDPSYSQHASPHSGLHGSPMTHHSSSVSNHSEHSASYPHSPSQHNPSQYGAASTSQAISTPLAPSGSTPASSYYTDAFQNPHTPFSAFEPAFMAPRRDGVANNSNNNSGGGGYGFGGSGSTLTSPTSAGPSGQGHSASMHSQTSGMPMGHSDVYPSINQMNLALDASPMRSPENMDLGWQFMSDLRPYL